MDWKAGLPLAWLAASPAFCGGSLTAGLCGQSPVQLAEGLGGGPGDNVSLLGVGLDLKAVGPGWPDLLP